MNTRVINPESMVLQQLDGHWQKLFGILLWKTVRLGVVEITPADIEAMNRHFSPGPGVVFTHGRGDSLEFSLITEDRAKVLAAHDAQFRGSA